MSFLPFPHGILFDFDGVVVQSSSQHWDAWYRASEMVLGQSVRQLDRATLSGQSSMAIAQHLAQFANQPDSAQALYDQKLALLLKQTSPPVPMPGVVALMSWLGEQGVPFGIASNAPTAYIRHCLKMMSLHITHVVGLDDVTHPKPNPEPFWILAQKLGFEPKDYPNLWVLEDSPTGMMAALASQMKAIGITKKHDDLFLQQGAVLVRSTPDEIFGILRRMDQLA